MFDFASFLEAIGIAVGTAGASIAAGNIIATLGIFVVALFSLLNIFSG